MYHPDVIAAKAKKLEQTFAATLSEGRLQRSPVATCTEYVRRLDRIWDPKKKIASRPFSSDEEQFILHEKLLCTIDYAYAAERYIWINYAGQKLQPMYPLWESQRLILGAIARVEEDHWKTGHPDGLLFNVLKGRQLGASTLIQSLLAHRVLTHAQVRTMIASDVPENSGSAGLFGMLELVVEHWPWWLKPAVQFHTKDKHIIFVNGSRVVVEAGKSMKGALQDEGGVKGQIGRSRTYSAVHLSELSTWEQPQEITNSLLPAVPITPRTIMGRESTAMGRNNYWHEEWKAAAADKDPRFFNVFVPFYAERSRYWLPCPVDWEPSPDTLAFAKRCEEHGPKYMHRPVQLTKEQLRWYELTKGKALHDDALYKFLSEYPAEPEEAFQHSGRSIFPVQVIDRVESQVRPIAEIWSVKPRGELLEDRERSIEEWRKTQVEMQEIRTRAREKAAADVPEGGLEKVIDSPTPIAVPREALP